MMEKIGISSDLKPGHMLLFSIGGTSIVVANVNGQFFGFSQRCTHSGGPLDQGELSGKIVSCPFHGAEFDITNGSCVGGPGRGDLRTYNIVEKDGELFLEI